MEVGVNGDLGRSVMGVATLVSKPGKEAAQILAPSAEERIVKVLLLKDVVAERHAVQV